MLWLASILPLQRIHAFFFRNLYKVEISGCFLLPILPVPFEKNFSDLALLFPQSALIPRKGKRPSLNLGDDTNFLPNLSAPPFQASYSEVSTVIAFFDVGQPFGFARPHHTQPLG